ncbi:helix-turn-helix transcriptional regulator [Falsirhodobacter xinxiangensis]|uniref:helix-turn-helix transcriptional regulator n=1 Tax=Falsirhodobacter xinxiangensis TaxID=2530049 RepID=UPI0010A9AA25
MYINDKQLAERFAVSRQSVWRWVKADPKFPRPYSLSPGCTRWKLSEIEIWEDCRSHAVAA